MFLKRGESTLAARPSGLPGKPQVLRAGSQLPGNQKSLKLPYQGRVEEGNEEAEEEFDLGRFFNAAEMYKDDVYMRMAVNLFEKAPKNTPLRSLTMMQSLAHRHQKRKGPEADPASMNARDKLVESRVTFTLPSGSSLDGAVYKASYKLPVERDKPSREARVALLKMLDSTNSGKMSIEELKFGFTRIVKIPGVDDVDEILDEVLRLAQRAVQDLMLDGAPRKEDDVHTKEFRVFLTYLQAYMDMWEIFTDADQANSETIDLDKFCKAAPKLKEWGLTDPALTRNPLQVFQQIDVDDSGLITFSEFADFCVKAGDLMEDGFKDLQIA